MPTKVVFRKFKDGGDIIAMFPRIPADRNGHDCVSYQHVGQHGAADPGIVSITTPATKKEYAPLLAELKRIGYKGLIISQRMTHDDFLTRKRIAKNER